MQPENPTVDLRPFEHIIQRGVESMAGRAATEVTLRRSENQGYIPSPNAGSASMAGIALLRGIQMGTKLDARTLVAVTDEVLNRHNFTKVVRGSDVYFYPAGSKLQR